MRDAFFCDHGATDKCCTDHLLAERRRDIRQRCVDVDNHRWSPQQFAYRIGRDVHHLMCLAASGGRASSYAMATALGAMLGTFLLIASSAFMRTPFGRRSSGVSIF